MRPLTDKPEREPISFTFQKVRKMIPVQHIREFDDLTLRWQAYIRAANHFHSIGSWEDLAEVNGAVAALHREMTTVEEKYGAYR